MTTELRLCFTITGASLPNKNEYLIELHSEMSSNLEAR